MAAAVDNRVRSLRQGEKNLTQQELADVVGVTRQTIIAIEKGRYSPSLEVALKIARALEQPVESVFWLI